MKNILLSLFVSMFVFGSFSPVAAADPLAIVQSVYVNSSNQIVISGLLPCSDHSAVPVVVRDPVKPLLKITVYAHDTRPDLECAMIPVPFTIYIASPFPAGTYKFTVNGVGYRSW